MALFSTLLQANATTTVSSSAIPELIQLYQTKAILLDPASGGGSPPNSSKGVVPSPKHGILSYQAIEVQDLLLDGGEGEGGLFSRRKSKANMIVKPNMGVWNAMVKATTTSSNSSTSSTETVDKLLRIPSTSSNYCLTVDLSKPSEVEPTMAALHSTLVRLVIEKPPAAADNDNKAATTTLAKLRTTQFGLANEDEKEKETTAEEDEKVKFALMICAVTAAPSATAVAADTNDAYKEKQAQALVLYHLRKYAAALNATLVFVRDDDGSSPQSTDGAGPAGTTTPEEKTEATEEGEQASMSLTQLSRVWKSWSSNEELLGGGSTENPALFGPTLSSSSPDATTPEQEGETEEEPEDLIETALLRNANYPGQWDAAKDSLWKALPCESEAKKDAGDETKEKEPTGDDHWLSKLRDSIEGGQAATTAASPTAPSAKDKQAAPKLDTASFFENLMK